MKTKLLAMTLLIGCGDKEETTIATPVETVTEQEVDVQNTTTTETNTEMVEVTNVTEKNTTNVEGEENND